MRVLIVADDLTGALDSAVPLASTGLHAVVARRPENVPSALKRQPDVLAVSTASREGGAEAARAAVRATVRAVGRPPPFVFKKVDSRLKGHAGAEASVLAEWLGSERALVAPAIPIQGRRVFGGEVTGAGVSVPIKVAEAFGATGLVLDIPDTADDADLDAALGRALGQGASGDAPLLVGAAGLAAALARRLAPPQGVSPQPPELRAPILLAIGSHDPITISQAARLEGGAAAVGMAPDGVCPMGLSVGPAQLLRLVPAEGRPFDVQAAGERFAEGIAELVRSGRFETLLACGGETADGILGVLGAGVLDLEGEVLPGVPVSTMFAAERRVKLVTKSGGFGGEDALVRVVEAAARGAEGRR